MLFLHWEAGMGEVGGGGGERRRRRGGGEKKKKNQNEKVEISEKSEKMEETVRMLMTFVCGMVGRAL